ncbi:MAG: hypothetical protein M1395_09340, partial [Bacteroidetes bacterium]|nr:hypothetical protein [Bacteroidota bacterium]
IPLPEAIETKRSGELPPNRTAIFTNSPDFQASYLRDYQNTNRAACSRHHSSTVPRGLQKVWDARIDILFDFIMLSRCIRGKLSTYLRK